MNQSLYEFFGGYFGEPSINVGFFLFAGLVLAIGIAHAALATYNIYSRTICTRSAHDYADQLFRVGCGCFLALAAISTYEPIPVLLGANARQFWMLLAAANGLASTMVRHHQLKNKCGGKR